MTRYTLAQVRDSYAQKRDWEKQFPVSRFIFRPLSYGLTFLVLRVTESPSRVAWAGWLVGLAGCAALAAAKELTPWPGVALIALFSLLDAVDGNVARTTRSVSRYGMYLDGMLGYTIECTYALFLACGLQRSFPAGQVEALAVPLIPAAGAVIALGYAFSGMFANSYAVHALKAGAETPAGSVTDPIGSSRHRGNPFYWLFINLHTLNFQLVVLCGALLAGRVDLFFFTFAAYYAVRSAVTFVYYMRRAAAELS